MHGSRDLNSSLVAHMRVCGYNPHLTLHSMPSELDYMVMSVNVFVSRAAFCCMNFFVDSFGTLSKL